MQIIPWHRFTCYTGSHVIVGTDMTNLTISLDEDIVRKARIRAIEEGTSVSAKVREFLAQYAKVDTSTKSAAPELPVYQGANGLHQGIDPGSNKSMRQAADGLDMPETGNP